MRNIFSLLFCFFTMTTMAQLNPISTAAYHWDEFPVNSSPEREARKILEGTSSHFEYLEIHATTQMKGAKPSPPHAQEDLEEVIIVKEGRMKFTMDGVSEVLGAGSIVLVPPLVMQSLENVGDGPLTYYVMMFRSKKTMNIERGIAAGGALFLNVDDLPLNPTNNGARRDYFNRPTAMTEKFEMHVTKLNNKGPSHDAHTHIATEIILVIEGETEMTMAGKEYKASAGDFYFISSNDLHSVRNATDKPCMYFAFQWK